MIYVTHDQVEAMTMADKIVVLQGGRDRAGRLADGAVTTTRGTSSWPASSARPKMNFMKTSAKAVKDGLVTVTLPGGTSLDVAVEPGRARVGAALTLGARPEHIALSDQGAVQGEVLVVERLGGSTLLHVKVEGGDLLTVQADGECPVHMHDKVGLAIAADRAHLFDEQGLAIPSVSRHPLADRKVRGGPTAAASK